MAGRGNGVFAEQRQALMRVRAQALLIARLNEQLKRESADGICSMRLDGMPKGRGGVPQGLDARVEKRDAIRRIAARESALLRRMEKEARRVMDGMKPEMYAFCALYYIGGLSIAQTAEAIDRSERQCVRYKREIEQGDAV